MNCKNCGYGLKQSCGDFEKIICTYEEGECVKITELEAQIKKMKADVELARDNANKTEDWETFSVLNSILDGWEIKENG